MQMFVYIFGYPLWFSVKLVLLIIFCKRQTWCAIVPSRSWLPLVRQCRSNYSQHAITSSARPCRAGAATVSLHQLRVLVAALIAGSRFKTMIYLIKPHFCIVSRAFVVVRSPIIPARPLLPGHEIAIDDHDPLDRNPFLLFPLQLFISPFFRKSHVIAFAGDARKKFPGKPRIGVAHSRPCLRKRNYMQSWHSPLFRFRGIQKRFLHRYDCGS